MVVNMASFLEVCKEVSGKIFPRAEIFDDAVPFLQRVAILGLLAVEFLFHMSRGPDLGSWG